MTDDMITEHLARAHLAESVTMDAETWTEVLQEVQRYRQTIHQAEQAQPVTHTLNCVCGATWDIKADGSEEMVNSPDATPPQRQPLTETAIRTIRCDMAGTLDVQYVAFARAIEAAHGIKEKNT